MLRRLRRVVETRALGCRCELGALPNNTNAYFSLPKEPTYWNGKDYVVPEDGFNWIAWTYGAPMQCRTRICA